MPGRGRSAGGAGGGGGGGGFLSSAQRFWVNTYAADWVGFTLLLTGYFTLAMFVQPFHRMFSLNDLRISFPHAEIERVPLLMAIVYALLLPLLFLTVFNTIARSSSHKTHVTLLGLLIAVALTTFLTDLIKNAVGRPRPDLLARCKPAPGTARDSLVSYTVCLETDPHTLHDGWRSFPSGHSSLAFAGLGYTTLFLAGQLRIFAHAAPTADGHAEKLVRGDLLRGLLAGTPVMGALMIAISRCQDYRHDVWDVCTGGLLGWTVAYWTYRRYWPRLGSARCDEPHPGPVFGDEEDGEGRGAGMNGRYGRLRDEEEGGANVGMELRELSR